MERSRYPYWRLQSYCRNYPSQSRLRRFGQKVVNTKLSASCISKCLPEKLLSLLRLWTSSLLADPTSIQALSHSIPLHDLLQNKTTQATHTVFENRAASRPCQSFVCVQPHSSRSCPFKQMGVEIIYIITYIYILLLVTVYNYIIYIYIYIYMYQTNIL